MTREEILQATFAVYVMLARQLKDNNVSTWVIYLYKAKDIYDLLNKKEDQTNVINMADYIKAAS
jgi:hypothetical protein